MHRTSRTLTVLLALAGFLIASNAIAQKRRMRVYQVAVEKKMDSMMQDGWKCVTNVHDSNDGDGQDLELRFTMPIDEFMNFAPKAALEAAAIPHKFPTVYIYLRHEDTRRIGRIAFRDAEPIAGRYRAGDADAVDEMADAIIWH